MGPYGLIYEYSVSNKDQHSLDLDTRINIATINVCESCYMLWTKITKFTKANEQRNTLI